MDPIPAASPPDAGIVLSSRVRLARNVEGHPFPGWMKKTQRENLLAEILAAANHLPEFQPPAIDRAMDALSPLEKQLLVEEHLISREHAARNAGSGLLVSTDRRLSLMVNEEDHIRLQCILPGYCLLQAWETAERSDSRLENRLSFAFSETLGYLTACPTNIGTGLRASAMLHLPGLVLMDQINKVIKSVNQIGLAVRGLYGEGTEALGNLFQISNQMTLGESETQIIERLLKVINKIVESESNARAKLLLEKSRMVADRLGRAYGNLLYAYSMSSKEALNLLSFIILGVDLAILPATLRDKLDELFVLTQPAHLQQAAGKKLNAEERDAFRADLLRDKLKGITAPNLKKLKL